MSGKDTWIIIPVYNRKAITLKCVRLLIEQGVTKWARVLIVDDASTDGTAAAILEALPEAVIVHGDGNLWWGGAMRLGMEHACREGAAHVFWLNDDCEPLPGAMDLLLKISQERQAITVAPCVLRETGEVHYGGKARTRWGQRQLDPAANEVVPCEVMAGNCVCIPRAVVDQIGGIDSADFPHVFGDGDYSLRAIEAGFSVLLVGGAKCLTTYGDGKNRQSWLVGESTVSELWAQCLNPYYGPLARASFVFRTRYWGFFGLLDFSHILCRLVVVSVVRSLLPASLIRRLAGRRSLAQARVEASRRMEAETSQV